MPKIRRYVSHIKYTEFTIENPKYQVDIMHGETILKSFGYFSLHPEDLETEVLNRVIELTDIRMFDDRLEDYSANVYTQDGELVGKITYNKQKYYYIFK